MNKNIKEKLLNLSEEIYKRSEVEEDCDNLISEYSNVFLTQFNNIKYPSDNFTIGSTDISLVTDIIPGSIRHRIYPYNQYNLVWLNPDTLEVIDNFILVNTPNVSSPFISLILSDLENGFIFEDLDRYNVKGIPDNIKEIDTLTHYIPDLSEENYLVYSKELGNSKKLVYKVFKPIKCDNDWICRVEFC